MVQISEYGRTKHADPFCDMTVEEMRQEDAAEVSCLERRIFSEPWSEQGFLSSLRSPDTLYLVVRRKGKLAGYCGFLQSFDEADITNVAVDESYRFRGVGQYMLRELMERGYARGVKRYTLEVRVSNAAALHLYEKLGFQSVGIRKGFYDSPKEDAVIMWTDEEDSRCSQ